MSGPFDPVKSDPTEPFATTQEPDEGYSEHPLYSAGGGAYGSNGAVVSSQSVADLAAWLSAQRHTISVQDKTRLAMLLLNDLPTTVIADIVMNHLNPRLYIDFIDYLPPEICLKIFGYLDPMSLIHVAMCCRGWYNLALDRKLWEKLYYLEGWQALLPEITTAEQRMNDMQRHSQRCLSPEEEHASKRRAISDPVGGDDRDAEMADVDQSYRLESRDTAMSGTSLFGGPMTKGSGSSARTTISVTQHLDDLMVASPSPMPGFPRRAPSSTDKGKGRASLMQSTSFDSGVVVRESTQLPRSAMWILDDRDGRYRINWKYLYTMRKRLEKNWDRGRFTNFQLPHPDHVEEGHLECIYSLQYNAEYLVSGSRDKSIRIWNLKTRRLVRPPLEDHTGSVLCLQFDSDPDEDLIVSGSSDSDVILWRFSTGQVIQRLRKAHQESVLNVKFDKRILVTCSKDRTIKIFNRVPLRAGDVGYGDINALSPVPITLKNYGYDDPLSQLPIKPPYTMIGCLEGHGAAVNAVQICGNEIVSASGDRHIKVWDWPNQICRRTFLGHNKGIACVQYDGRRIVSGSSDNEVKVFDRETGLEVASLRAHGNLVRTVQAGFGDLPYSVEEDNLQARAVDRAYFKARDAGELDEHERSRSRPLNSGSRRPQDITAYGAKLPPGGGGGPCGRIVSGSYDQTIIIWRRDEEGVWRSAHTLRQEEGARAALQQHPPSTSSLTALRSSSPGVSASRRPSPAQLATQPPQPPASAPPQLQPNSVSSHGLPPIRAAGPPQSNLPYTRMVDAIVPQGPGALQQALATYPTMLSYHSQIQAAIDRETNPNSRRQLRQVVTNALVRAQMAQNRTMASLHDSTASTSQLPGVSQLARLDALDQPSPLAALSRSGSTFGGSEQSSSFAAGPSGPSTMPSISNLLHQPPQTSTQATPPSIHPTHAQTLPIPQAAGSSLAGGAANNTAAAVGHQPPQQHQPTQQQQQHHPHIAQGGDAANPARIFKLQFDARRIICCSQTSTIVGWDFCNGDPELEEVARFFATVK
ncbi:F-box and WD-40 domain protein 1/11 [Microdochium nivale]|nr:F-box and WD-40 domain protein 1/11 [Microdochium nivale]